MCSANCCLFICFFGFSMDNFLLVNRSRFAIKGAFDCRFNCMIIELACGLFSEILLLYPLVKLCILNLARTYFVLDLCN